MLKNIINFSYRRNSSEAVVFYLEYLIMATIASALLAGIIASIVSNDSKEFFLRLSSLAMIVIVFNLGFLILGAKQLTEDSKSVILVVISSFLAYFGGGLLGLIIIAYLTTQGYEEKRLDPDIPLPSL